MHGTRTNLSKIPLGRSELTVVVVAPTFNLLLGCNTARMNLARTESRHFMQRYRVNLAVVIIAPAQDIVIRRNPTGMKNSRTNFDKGPIRWRGCTSV